MSIVDDLEDTEIAGKTGDSYILRKKGTNIYGVIYKSRFLELGQKYMDTMKAIQNELYGSFINELIMIARKSPEAIIKAADDKKWLIEEDEEKVNMFLSKKLDKNEGILITFVPPVTSPDFFEWYGDGSVSIHYTVKYKLIHAKNTPEDKIPQVVDTLKELIDATKKYL